MRAFDLHNLDVAKRSTDTEKDGNKHKDAKLNKKVFEDIEREENDFLEFAID